MGCGPEALLGSGIESILRRQGHTVRTECIEIKDPFPTEIATSFAINRELAGRVIESMNRSEWPLVLSGNCGSTMGVLAALTGHGSNIGLAWFDAHGDFNTPETTATGFLDGMGLATIAGRCWTTLAATIPDFQPLTERKILHIGGRDFDKEESLAIVKSQISVVQALEIERRGIEPAFAKGVAAMWSDGVRQIHLHFDMDVLDPKVACANGFAAPNGLSLSQAVKAIELLSSTFRLCSATISSFDPAVAPGDKTLQAGIAIIEAIVCGAQTKAG